MTEKKDIIGEDSRRARGRPRAFYEKTEQNTIKSLDRAIGLLEELAHREDQSLSALGERLGESSATLYRTLVTLQKHGFVAFDEADQSWSIGPGAFQVGSAFLRRTGVVERSRPMLRHLMEETGETANLGIADHDTALFLSQVETHASIRAFFPPGTRSPLHASGIGKVLLAGFSPDRLNAFLRAPLDAFTGSTITDPARLRVEIETIRQAGYSVDDEERNPGMRCIAAPIYNLHGETIAGMSVSGPVSRVSLDRVGALGETVKAAAGTLSAALGYSSGAKG